MTTTCAYIRVSSTKQLEGAGPQQQRDAIIAYATMKGIQIDGFYVDDETGTTEEREQIQALLLLAKSGTLKLLLVDRVDRLGRTLGVCESLYDQFKQAGCKIEFVAAAFDDNPEGVLFRQMLGMVAQYQRGALLRHMKSCREANARIRGTHGNGQVPYGYRIDRQRNRVVIEEEEAALVRRVFALRGEGLSLRKIADRLYADGYRPRYAKSGKFSTAVLANMVHDEEAYRGKTGFVDNSSVTHPAILSS